MFPGGGPFQGQMPGMMPGMTFMVGAMGALECFDTGASPLAPSTVHLLHVPHGTICGCCTLMTHDDEWLNVSTTAALSALDDESILKYA